MKIKCKHCGLKWDSRWGTKFYIVDPVSGEGCCIECHNIKELGDSKIKFYGATERDEVIFDYEKTLIRLEKEQL